MIGLCPCKSWPKLTRLKRAASELSRTLLKAETVACNDRIVVRRTLPEAFPQKIRSLDEERPSVAPEAGSHLAGEWVLETVIHIVVVADIERRAGARCPAKQQLAAQPLIECVVVKDRAGERGLGELIGAAQRPDVDVVSDAARVVSLEPLLGQTERHAQRVCWLIRNAAVELHQASAAGIERRALSQ